MRLGGGASPHEGHIEMFLLGQWGTLCGDVTTWSLADASIICQELKYYEAAAALTSASMVFGKGIGPTWFFNVGNCIGSNMNITECSKSLRVTRDYCSQNDFDVVGVICKSKI